MKKTLGQYMTPEPITALIAQLVGNCDAVIDFAVGTGELLKAVQLFNKNQIITVGYDIDSEVLDVAKKQLKSKNLFLGNGLTMPLPKFHKKKIVIVGNPPYIPNQKTGTYWSDKVLDYCNNQIGIDRSEIQFLCRSIATAHFFSSKVIIIMPISFADGDKYSLIRAAIMKKYYIEKCIEIPSGTFKNTEARTAILVIDTTSNSASKITDICLYDIEKKTYTSVYKKVLQPGNRLDARYYSIKSKIKISTVLSDLNVSIVRGDITNKVAKTKNIKAIHTSDFKNLIQKEGKLEKIFNDELNCLPQEIKTIEKGDIILARTGKRVSWEPIIISSGIATITDHVFRIRVPVELRSIVQQSFFHPYFNEWLRATCKGVCATVLTKRELMGMPVFALESKSEYQQPHKGATSLS